jgi:hypothetical protein
MIYVDAGCHFNPRGRQWIEKYVALLTPESPILAFKYNGACKDNILQAREVPDWNNEAWTKEDLFVAFMRSLARQYTQTKPITLPLSCCSTNLKRGNFYPTG